jgi:hypothetical protein
VDEPLPELEPASLFAEPLPELEPASLFAEPLPELEPLSVVPPSLVGVVLELLLEQ